MQQQENGVPAWAKGAVAIIGAIATLVVALAAAGVIGGSEKETIREVQAAPVVPAAVAVDGPDRDAEPGDEVIELGDRAQDVVEDVADTPERFDLAGDLRGDDSTPVAEHDGPLATPNFPGCETRILPTNWSNRVTGVRGIGLHYTAGPNRAGKAEMDGLTAYASSARAGVSWHFLIDAEGHCYYSVPLGKKAWTIGNANSQTVNIEVVGTGQEASYPAGTAGARKLRQVVRRVARIYSIPLKVGSISNCSVSPGIVTHWQGGACAGGHIDIRPFEIQRVVDAIATDPCGTRCRARKRQRAVLEGRRRKHAALHEKYANARCRRDMHEQRLRSYTRAECRALKRRGHAQHVGITRARKKLGRL